MRYAVISTSLSLSEMEAKVKQYGGRDIRLAPLSGQLFCELDTEKAALLAKVSGLAVRPVERMQLHQVTRAPAVYGPVYTAAQTALSTLFYDFRSMFSPPVTGLGFTIAILDSGIRKTHLGLQGKVVYEVNLSDAPSAEDVYDHGTGVAYLAAGGKHGVGEDAGMAPGASLMNIKVIDDDGTGSSEDVVTGIEKAIELAQAYPPGNPMHPDLINLSFGGPDFGDSLEPVRVAARAAVAKGIWVVVAAGNTGPGAGTIGSPAADPQVFAVGAMSFEPWQIWDKSSRGPTKEGTIKPDLVFYGVNILTASGKAVH